uniref:Uncharacterized protein n=1 Tax=Vespula pensylvanica TaxID=30213 RepID=A0A836UWH9_VESPE|nr:hypothetical protein H0235_013901 [Vespula pensylvanica]
MQQPPRGGTWVDSTCDISKFRSRLYHAGTIERMAAYFMGFEIVIPKIGSSNESAAPPSPPPPPPPPPSLYHPFVLRSRAEHHRIHSRIGYIAINLHRGSPWWLAGTPQHNDDDLILLPSRHSKHYRTPSPCNFYSEN